MTGCTMTPQQTQATVDTVDIIGKTVTEIISIYGKPLSSMTLDKRDTMNGDTVEIYDYEGFSVVFENGVAVAVHKTTILDIMRNMN
jgi:hypothetical protein